MAVKAHWGETVTAVSTGWKIFRKVGLEKRKNYNSGSGEGMVPICPLEKEDAIMDAFRYFCLI